jgi:bifunctional ADP-heptose synthase (sugar kinase/adenylyltransferase)
MLTTGIIEHILSTVPHRTVGLLGDLFLDRYLEIDPALDEPSIETGLTAYQVTRVRSLPGALGTVVNNLVALGVGRIYPIAVIGDDGEGYELRQALARLPGVELGGLVVAPDRRTPTYTKPMRGEQELNRLDIKNRTPTPAGYEDAVIALLEEAWPQFDALLVLDQVSEANCGVVTDRVRERLAEIAGGDPGRFVLADSRERIGRFRKVCVKPNRQECLGSAEMPNAATGPGPHALSLQLGRHVFLTDGPNGIVLHHPTLATRYDSDVPPRPGSTRWSNVFGKHVPAYPVSGPIDVVGAGDSCSAGIACGMVSGCTPEQAAAFGNLVASITVQQLGTTGTASPRQVRERWREVSGM